MANEFNNHFTSISKNINTKQNKFNPYNTDNITPLHYLTQLFRNPFPNINLKTVSTNEIKNIIKSLKPKNSLGYDGIPTKLLRVSSPFITSPLTPICNKCIFSGTFPDCLKYAVVKPLFQKGDKTNLLNYRPISILSSFSKVIEKVMYKQLQDHLNKYDILAQEQFGFRSDSATDKAIYKVN